ncbi:MAG: InlB B-repeat-containing protein [Bacilli bacterium]
MKKISNKGFTLIELLATILIIGLVLGITTYGIISSVNKAKEKSTILSLTSVKEAARTYSGELGEDSWKNIIGYENTYFCVTIEELINKGLLNKNANSVENGGEIVDYVVVVKNKTTKVIEKEEILTGSNSDTVAYQICTGNIKNEDITTGTQIGDTESYTDTVYINFTDAKFESKITERHCEYGYSSTNMNNEGTIIDNKCTLEELTQGTTYYTRVCEKSERESVSCSSAVAVKTQNIVDPTIAVDTNKNNSVKITYDNSNIIGDAFYYFKSTIDGTSSKNVSTCSLDDNKYNCNNDSVNNITKDTRYKVSDNEISITYNTPGNITVTAETRDKSDNLNSSTKEFSLYKTTFNKGNADTIGGQTNNIELMCLANKGNSCSITSPSIEKSGYQVIGWNTNSSATTSSWDVNTLKSINTTETYYPVTKLNTYTITYDNNGGSGCTTKNVVYNSQIGSLCTPSRTGYTFIGWYNSDYKDIPLNYYADTYSDLYNAFGYDVDKLYNHYLTYGINEGRRISQYIPTDIYNYSSNKTIYAGWKKNKVIIEFSVNNGTLVSGSPYSVDSNGIVLKNNSHLLSKIEYNTTIGNNGLPNYNNSSYLNVSRTGYTVVAGKEWICLSGECKGEIYSQSDETLTSSNFCDASNGDCIVILGVNWIPNTPQFIASDGKDSESWHISTFSLTLTNTSDDVDYFYGTSGNNITTKYSSQINVTNNNTYYAKACSKSDYNNCSGVTTYVAQIDRNPPIVEITLYNTSTGATISSDKYSSSKNNLLPWLPYNVTIYYTFSDEETGIDTTTAQFKYNYEFQRELNDDDLLVSDNISLSNGSTSYNRGVELDGDRKFYFKICDAAGNCSGKYIYFRTDTQKPIIYKIDDTVKIGCTTLSGIKDSVVYQDGIERYGFVSKDYKNTDYNISDNDGIISHPYNDASIYASCTNKAGICSKVKIKKTSTASEGCYYRVKYYGFDGPASSTVNKCSTVTIVGGVCGNQRIYTDCTSVDKSFCGSDSSRCVQYKSWYVGSNVSDSFVLEEQSSC